MKPLHELDALCAERVAGRGDVMPAGYVDPESGTTYYTPTGGTFHNPFRRQIPSYTTDPAAVLGLLEKYDWIAGNHLLDGDYFCEINYPESRVIERAPTFPLAATLALLRAHGVETE